MATENREAEHMLGHNDPKQTKQQKETQMKSAWHEYKKKNNDKSISQQAAQAMLSSKLPSAAFLLFADYVHTECY